MSAHPTADRPDDEPLRLRYDARLAYTYAAGRHASRFMTALRDERKLLGIKAPDGRVLVPPRVVDGEVAQPTAEWVEVGPRGTVTGCTIVEVPFVDPMTGQQRPVPYGFGFIRLDGADTNMYHFLEATSHDEIEVGMRVEAVFKPDGERQGQMSDIVGFRRVADDEEASS